MSSRSAAKGSASPSRRSTAATDTPQIPFGNDNKKSFALAHILAISTMSCFFVLSACAQAPYTVPSSDAHALNGINFSHTQTIGQDLTQLYQDCDRKTERGGCFTDPARNTVILKFNNGPVFFDAKMAIDADGSALSKKAQRPNQPETSFRYPTTGTSLDSERVPYIVVPLGSFRQVSGIGLGDIAAVVKDGHVHFAIVGDLGPRTHIGEGSLYLHMLFGQPVCRAYDANHNCSDFLDTSLDPPVLYFLFPDSRKLIIDGLSPENVDDRIYEVGRKLWKDFLQQQSQMPAQAAAQQTAAPQEGADAHRLP